jgi:hypothetical protein
MVDGKLQKGDCSKGKTDEVTMFIGHLLKDSLSEITVRLGFMRLRSQSVPEEVDTDNGTSSVFEQVSKSA